MTALFARSGLAIALIVSAGGAAGHHAFAPVYDGERTVTIEGVVAAFRFVNPHASILIDVSDVDGRTARWTVEMAGRLNLSVGGWTDDSVKPGERVTISGNPMHSGELGLFLTTLIRADGTELKTPGAQRRSALEEARRQRAQQRPQTN